MMALPLVVPHSLFEEFERHWRDKRYQGLRWGQAFYGFMKMERMTNTPEMNHLYFAGYVEARQMVEQVIDWEH
jgi:hypothetical protein